MAKGGYQKRRIAEKKARERASRKRAARRRKALTVVASALVLGMIGVVVLAALGGDEPLVDPDATPTPEPTATGATFADPCTDLASVEPGQVTFDDAPCRITEDGIDYAAVFETSEGTIEVDLLEADAPVTVNNFVFLARTGYYDGTPFHRVLPEFGDPSAMVQGGDAVNRDGTGGPGYQFGDENIIPFDTPGMLAMANAGPGTNGSQFFFLDGTVPHLNSPDPAASRGSHSVFGRVTDGLEIVRKIAATGNGAVELVSVTIEES